MAFWRKKEQSTSLNQGLEKTRHRVSQALTNIWKSSELNDETWTLVRRALLCADIGLPMTQTLIQQLQTHCKKSSIHTVEAMWQALATILISHMDSQTWEPQRQTDPQIILLVGINGGGKTTSVAKLGAYLTKKDYLVLLAAGDTFRAAASEQLHSWAKKAELPIVSQAPGADSAALIYDAYQSAKAQQLDYVIADTAGRLPTQKHLMDELAKIKRVLSRCHPKAPHEIWLVLDACIGQNSLAQAREFHKTLGVTGLIMTKLDGSAKGGAALAIAEELGLPIRFIGLGEQLEDWEAFQAEPFVSSLLPKHANA